jgi:hypothetical protein
MNVWKSLTAISVALLCQSYAFSAPSDLKWLNGENVCTGSWNYTQMASCGYADDTNSPIYTTVNEDFVVVEPCRVKEVYDVVETRDVPIEWEDSRTAPSCGPYKPSDIDSNLDYWTTGLGGGIRDITGPRNGRCKKRNSFRTCVSWHDVFNANCRFERRVARTISDAAICPTRTEQRPKKVRVGYDKIVGPHPSCPGAKPLVSGKFLPKSSVIAADIIPESIKCSTLDDVAATTPEIVRAKFDAYMAQAFELAGVEGQCDLKKPLYVGLQAIAENGTEALTEDQLGLAFEFVDILTAECNPSTPVTSSTTQTLEQILGDKALAYRDNFRQVQASIQGRTLLVALTGRMDGVEYRLNLDTMAISEKKSLYMSADVSREALKADALYKELLDGLKLSASWLASSGPEGKALTSYLESSL